MKISKLKLCICLLVLGLAGWLYPMQTLVGIITLTAVLNILNPKPYAFGLTSEGRIAQAATSPLLTNFAVTASQKAIRPIGQFIAPLCEVPDLTFRYKVYTEKNRYKVPDTKRQPGGKVTRIGFTAQDALAQLEPNALDFPILNVDGLSDDGLNYAIMEGQSTLADAAGLGLENEIVQLAQTAAIASPLSQAVDFTDNTVDPVAILDNIILQVKKAVKNGAQVKVLFGTTKFKQFRDNQNVRSRFIIASGANAVGGGPGVVSPNINDVGKLLIFNPEVACSEMVIDTAAEGLAANIQFLLDTVCIVFASSGTPNRMNPSFMKTFSRSGGFFKPGNYMTEDQRDQVLKMDWTTLPSITNTAAVAAVM